MKKQNQILSKSAFVYRKLWITNLLEMQGNFFLYPGEISFGVWV